MTINRAYTKAEHIDWQPAETMPEAAATQWHEIEEVRVCQCKDLSTELLVAAGLIEAGSVVSRYPSITEPLDISLGNPDVLANAAQAIKNAQCCAKWNAAHPDHSWQNDRHLVALRVTPAIFDTSKQR